MKGLFLFNPLNDVSFMSIDEDLAVFINKQARKASLLDDEAILKSVDPNIVLQLFSPLITSQRFMFSEVQNPYNSVRCENNVIYVFLQFSEYIAMTIGSVLDETEEFYQRKLLVFKRLLVLFHGPVIMQLHKVTPPKDEKWHLIGQLLDQWECLFHEEQSFLVEALERLSVNEGLNGRCMKLLESALSMIKSAGDKHIGHALLFVRCKLMSLYSSRSAFDLGSADILLMILLANMLYPWQPTETMTTTSCNSRHGSTSEGRVVEQKPGSLDNSGRSKPKTAGSSLSELTHSLYNNVKHVLSLSAWTQSHSAVSSDSENTVQSAPGGLSLTEAGYQEWTFLDDLQADGNWDADSFKLQTAKLFSTPSSSQNKAFMSESELRTDSHSSHSKRNSSGREGDYHSNHTSQHANHDNTIIKRSDDKDGTSYHSYTVFVWTKLCSHTPVTLYIVHILPGIILALVSELPKISHANILSHALRTVVMATECQCHPLATILPAVDGALRKLSEIQKRSKNVAGLDQLVHAVHGRWDVAKQILLNVEKKTPMDSTNIRLENTLRGLGRSLEDVFIKLYLCPRHVTKQTEKSLHKAICSISKKFRNDLADYHDYLTTRSLQNLMLGTYLEEFPGLVHFIYVDRNSDYMRAPSMEMLPPGGNCKKQMNQTVKHKVWDIVQWLQTRVSAGYTSVVSRDRQLYFSYFLWFEDAMGNPLMMQQPFRGSRNGVLPGILAGDFYRKLVEDCFPSSAKQKTVRCYELLCVHVGLVPTQYVLSHCRKMAAMLWEASDMPSALSIL